MSYGIFNYESDELGTCMMLIYDMDEQTGQSTRAVGGSQKPKGTLNKTESTNVIKQSRVIDANVVAPAQQQTQSQQRLLSGTVQSQRKVYEIPNGFNPGMNQKRNGDTKLPNSYQQDAPYFDNFTGNSMSQTMGSFSRGNRNIFNSSNQQQSQYMSLQGQNSSYQQLQQQQQQHLPHNGMQQQQQGQTEQYNQFANMMRNIDQDTFKNYMAQFQQDQRQQQGRFN